MPKSIDTIKDDIFRALEGYFYKKSSAFVSWSSEEEGLKRRGFARQSKFDLQDKWKWFHGNLDDKLSRSNLCQMKQDLEQLPNNLFKQHGITELKGLKTVIKGQIAILDKSIEEIDKKSYSTVSGTIKKIKENNTNQAKSNTYNVFQLEQFNTLEQESNQTTNHEPT
ncbi:hypothetical protein [Piscirickettsia salmonis]|uniref:hypothetical protein n=1 Tax=Piscirickettsia salmonis TaxID=1238 RepID=UPI0007C956FD|nr:hypothetical protein A0O36_02359 [Piscirickettsiaceae bacterium NZ-RLO1]